MEKFLLHLLPYLGLACVVLIIYNINYKVRTIECEVECLVSLLASFMEVKIKYKDTMADIYLLNFLKEEYPSLSEALETLSKDELLEVINRNLDIMAIHNKNKNNSK